MYIAPTFSKKKFNPSKLQEYIIINTSVISAKELSLLHDKHLNRPTLDDNVDEEHEIEIITQEITQVNVLFYFSLSCSIGLSTYYILFRYLSIAIKKLKASEEPAKNLRIKNL